MDTLTLTLRSDGTYDYHWVPPLTREDVPGLLRGIAEQIEQGADVPDPVI